MMRFAATLILCFPAFCNVIAQGLPDTLKRAVDSGNHSAAISELIALRLSDENSFVDNDHDYLLARLAEADGQLALALVNYQAVADRDSVLRNNALKHLAQLARSTGNPFLERQYLSELALVSPTTPLVRAAALRLAHNRFESGDYYETIRILNGGLPLGNAKNVSRLIKDAAERKNKVLLAEAYLHSGHLKIARGLFIEMIDKTPNPAQPDDAALAAVKKLDVLDNAKDTFALNESELLQRANIYQFNREFTAARRHFESVIANFPASSNTADAAFQIGRGFGQLEEYTESLKWFERVLEQYPDTPIAIDALLQAAAAYGRVGKPREALNRYQAFINKYPADERLHRAYLNSVDIHRDQGSDTEALNWCRKTEEVFKGKLPESLAVFSASRIYLAKEDWPNALASLERLNEFSDLGGPDVPGGTSRAEVAFLKGFVLEQMKRYAEVIDIYLSIPDGRGEYYGWSATKRLKNLSGDETANAFLMVRTAGLLDGLKSKDPDTKRRTATNILRISDLAAVREKALVALKTVIKPPRYPENSKSTDDKGIASGITAASRLLSLRLYDEAVPEMLAARADNAEFLSAEILNRGNRADLVMALIDPVWKNVAADFPVEAIPREQLAMLYPAPYRNQLLANAAKYGVDPRLLLAIMRQESRFQPDAKSYAAARGLMQFISTTSKRVADELGRENFRQDDLYDPATSILFGYHYLAGLFKIFPNQPEAVAASYNGGDTNMKRWLTRSRSSLAERYVPEIAYSQSKDYVYKVMANYRMYQHIYDEELKARL